MSNTKQRFCDIIERELKKHPWAQGADRLERAMVSVKKTINGSRTCALSESWALAWKEIGMKGKPTYKGIHALPGTL